MNVTLTLFCVLCTRAHTFVQWGSFSICATLVFEKESLTEPGAQELTRLASEAPDPPSLSVTPGLGIQAFTAVSDFLQGPGDLNSGPRVPTVSTFLTGPSPHL